MSGSETLAAFPATRLEHVATGPGPHAVPKAMAALPAPNFWLIGPLHRNTQDRGGGLAASHRVRKQSSAGRNATGTGYGLTIL